MKKIICFALALLLIFTACSNERQEDRNILENSEYDSISEILEDKTEGITAFEGTLVDVSWFFDDGFSLSDSCCLSAEKLPEFE